MTGDRLWLGLSLVATGVVWGLTIPLTKIAVSTGYQPIGLLVWELMIGGALLVVINAARRRLFLPNRAQVGRCLLIGLTGTVVPGYFSFWVYAELPGGIVSIMLSLVPMFAMPVALYLGLERPEWRRFLGVCLGALAVLMIAAPDTSLPDPAKAGFVLLALISPFCYGLEGNLIAWKGTAGLGPMQLLMGAMISGLVLLLPLSLSTGAFISLAHRWGPPEWAILGMTILHVVAYTSYVWIVGRAGSVFAAQVAYVVTGSGVFWSMIILGERYSGWIWAAFLLIMIGISLVSPRQKSRQAAT